MRGRWRWSGNRKTSQKPEHLAPRSPSPRPRHQSWQSSLLLSSPLHPFPVVSNQPRPHQHHLPPIPRGLLQSTVRSVASRSVMRGPPAPNVLHGFSWSWGENFNRVSSAAARPWWSYLSEGSGPPAGLPSLPSLLSELQSPVFRPSLPERARCFPTMQFL